MIKLRQGRNGRIVTFEVALSNTQHSHDEPTVSAAMYRSAGGTDNLASVPLTSWQLSL